MAKTAADKKAEIADLISRLEVFTEEFDEDDYKQFAKLTERYSERNAMLILMQRPSAKEIHGYTEWKRHGRQVKKDSKGIRILAPAGHAKVTDKVTGEEKDGRAFYKLVFVFDIAQTEEISNG